MLLFALGEKGKLDYFGRLSQALVFCRQFLTHRILYCCVDHLPSATRSKRCVRLSPAARPSKPVRTSSSSSSPRSSPRPSSSSSALPPFHQGLLHAVLAALHPLPSSFSSSSSDHWLDALHLASIVTGAMSIVQEKPKPVFSGLARVWTSPICVFWF